MFARNHITARLFLVCLIITFLTFHERVAAQDLMVEHADHLGHSGEETISGSLNYIQNDGQWEDQIAYDCPLGGLNHLFLEADKFIFLLHDRQQMRELHDVMRTPAWRNGPHRMRGHAYSVNFIDALTPSFTEAATSPKTRTYLLGNKPEKWAGNVASHGKITYENLYQGIDLVAYGADGNFKYDFIVEAGKNPASIRLSYEGTDGLYLDNGDLVVLTSVDTIRELRPYAYQNIEGKEVPVACAYRLTGDTLSFTFPGGYNDLYALVIDPTVVGATLAGTISETTFGHSATSDNAGNMYVAGIAFGNGYPSTMGAFDNDFSGGQTDISVSKFNQDGTDLLYSTYIGGFGDEYPYSTIVDANGQLCILGSSTSINYPTTANAVQSDLKGQADLIVTKLNAAGSGLVGSTYLGGSGTDGLNFSINNFDPGDRYRGEIVLDNNDNIYVATCTNSTDFPVTENAFQTTARTTDFDLLQDGIVAKLNSDLSTLFWSTYLGGTGRDLCNALRVDDENSVYVTGFAGASDFPMVAGGVQSAWPGGEESGYLVKLSADGSTMLNGTFWGTAEKDRSYFVDIDEDDQVHIFGLTKGNIAVTPGTWFANAGSSQFVTGFSKDLSSLVYSTVIGTGINLPFLDASDFIPVAFMVDKCNGIYLSGYQSVPDLPLTSDRISTEANSFYLAKLEPNATGLSFGSYYGEANHVDGGTSRFNKGGVVYQAVCSCLRGENVLNTTPGAWSNGEDQFTDCDAGVFKIDFDVEVVTAIGVASPSASGCAPFTIDFTYTGRDAEVISWDFGTGDTVIGETPTYTFSEAGSYTVMQVASSPQSCNLSDTFLIRIDVLDENSTVSERSICSGGDPLFLDVTTPNARYTWQDGATVATYRPMIAGIYWVDVAVEGCTRRDTFLVTNPMDLAVDLGEDQTVCDIGTYTLDASSPAAEFYRWQDGSAGADFTVSSPGAYSVVLTDSRGCEVSDTIVLDFGSSVIFDLGEDQERCAGESLLLEVAAPGAGYEWQDGSVASSYEVRETGIYVVSVNNDGCLSADSVAVIFKPAPEVVFSATELLCPGENDGFIMATDLSQAGPLTYRWETGAFSPDRENLSPGIYRVVVTNEANCTSEYAIEIFLSTETLFELEVTPIPCSELSGGIITANDLRGGTPPYLYALNDGAFGPEASFTDLTGGDYTVSVQDANGCLSVREATIIQPAIITVDAGRDIIINAGDDVRLEGAVNSPMDLRLAWLPTPEFSCADCLRTVDTPASTTTYRLTALDTLSNCLYQDSVMVTVNQRRQVYIPTSFSPNGDGINDRLFINTDRSVSYISYLRVYGRWGGLLFEGRNIPANDPDVGWDGRLNGKEVGEQVVVYVTEVVFKDGIVRTYEGDVLVIR